MRGHSTIPLTCAWNTWSTRPAELVYQPLGFRITPVLYSSRNRMTSLIEPRRDSVRFGRHTTDNRLMELETELAGTRIGFRAGAVDPFVVRGTWNATELGEWGTRFWLTLAVSVASGETVSYDPEEGVVLIEIDRRFMAVATDVAPIQVTAHDSIAALREDFETNGYFYTATRGHSAAILGLRFNMEMMRSGGYAAAIADSAALAIEKARAALSRVPENLPPLHEGLNAGSLDAVRDIVGWNTIWDPVNDRAYTAVTRIWNLGDFAVWYNDQTFAALAASPFDTDLARKNMAVALAGATPQGNIACIVTSNDAWVDRSQPPHGALVAWLCYLRSGERSILEESFEALARNQRWWRQNRDPDKTGLISCGTSNVGAGLYKGMVFAARNETGMDNSATHDEALFDAETGTLSTFDLGLNAALALDAEMLANMAHVLGRRAEAEEFSALAQSSRDLIRTELWDEARGLFANRQRKGGFVRSVSPTSFYPLLCGAASPEQARQLLGHLTDGSTFGGDFVLPNATRDDPAFDENVYWRGRIWPNVNYLVWLGLKRYGFNAEAAELARKSHDLFMKNWSADRVAAENYNATTGEAMDQGDTDPFYIWAALLPLMAVEEIAGFDPWKGWTLTNTGMDLSVGPFLTPIGPATVRVADGRLNLSQDARALLATSVKGRISGLSFERGAFACMIEDEAGAGGQLTLSGLRKQDVVAARLDGRDVTWEVSGDGVCFEFPPGGANGKFMVWHTPANAV